MIGNNRDVFFLFLQCFFVFYEKKHLALRVRTLQYYYATTISIFVREVPICKTMLDVERIALKIR